VSEVSYERCGPHKLLRCGICLRATQTQKVPAEVLDGPGFVPEGKTPADGSIDDPATMEYLKDESPKLTARAPLSPIETAASEYASAQRAMTLVARKVESFQVQLKNAEQELQDAKEDLEIKKAVLQKLVTL
jgi:hypothetical protein